jgi:hypothetical protein
MTSHADYVGHRYRVVEAWGDVPDSITSLIDEPDAYLIYPEFRGAESQQDLMDMTRARIKGGWYMEWAGYVDAVSHNDGSGTDGTLAP